MANVGPLQLFTNVANLKTIPDITRFLTAFCTQVKIQFNNNISTKQIAGIVSGSGTVVGGSFFAASMMSSTSFYVIFDNPFSHLYSVVASPNAKANAFAILGQSLNSFTYTGSSNTGFGFLAMGAR